MPKIFISYRREDTQWPADRLYRALKPLMPNPESDIFIDVDNIPLGVDFVDHLDSRVAQCDVLLAVIGADWINVRSPETGKRRLDDPKDFVRVEIGAALKRKIPVVPVLIDGAKFPDPKLLPADLQGLATRHGVEVGRLTFDADMERLARGLGLIANPDAKAAPAKPAEEKTGKPMFMVVVAATAGLVVIAALLAFNLLTVHPPSQPAEPARSAGALLFEEIKVIDPPQQPQGRVRNELQDVTVITAPLPVDAAGKTVTVMVRASARTGVGVNGTISATVSVITSAEERQLCLQPTKVGSGLIATSLTCQFVATTAIKSLKIEAPNHGADGDKIMAQIWY